MYGKKATEKIFPSFVFDLNPQKIAFLIAKMWEGDGCINIGKNGYVNTYYATSSVKSFERSMTFTFSLPACFAAANLWCPLNT